MRAKQAFKPRFCFGPLAGDALDARLQPALLALGGQPLRVHAGALWTSEDSPGFSQWRRLDPQGAALPLLWISPCERPLPGAWASHFTRVLALGRDLGRWSRELPSLAGLAGAWACELPFERELLARAGVPAYSWLGYAEGLAAPLPPSREALILPPADWRPPASWLDSPGLLWSVPDGSLQLLTELRRSRWALAGPEALPELLQARAAGTRCLLLAGEAYDELSRELGLLRIDPEALEALVYAVKALEVAPIQTEPSVAEPAVSEPPANVFHIDAFPVDVSSVDVPLDLVDLDLEYFTVLGGLVELLLALPEGPASEASLALLSSLASPLNPWNRLLQALGQRDWEAAASWRAEDGAWPLPAGPLPAPLASLLTPGLLRGSGLLSAAGPMPSDVSEASSDASETSEASMAFTRLEVWLAARRHQARGELAAARELLREARHPALLALARELAWQAGDRAAASTIHQALLPLAAWQPETLVWRTRLGELSLAAALAGLRRRREGLALQLPLLGEALAGDAACGVWWEGPFAASQSLARINDALCERLAGAGDLAPWPIPTEPLPDDRADELPPSRDGLVNPVPPSLPPAVLVSHRYPPRLGRFGAAARVNILPWEYGALPKSWLALSATLAEVWVPSAAVRSAFWLADSGPDGFRPGQVRLIPNGVDTAVYAPEGPRRSLDSGAGFHFLFLGGLLRRKGVDLLLEAYAQAFTAADDVCLVIKDWGAAGIYALDPERRRLEAHYARALRGEGPRIHWLRDEDALDDAHLAALYRACDVYVQPYRGEGFGLPLLEAMACGLPVILSDAGPGPEFCPPQAGWQVRSLPRFEPELETGAGPLCADPWWHVCDSADLIRCLREAYAAGPDARRALGQAARSAALGYDWQLIAARTRTRLQALVALAARPGADSASDQLPTRALAWQAGDLSKQGLSLPLAPGWDWAEPGAAADFAIVPAGQGEPGQALWWLERLPKGLALPAKALWLAADPYLAEALIAAGGEPARIGLLPPSRDFSAPLPAAPLLAEPGRPVILALCDEAPESIPGPESFLEPLLLAWGQAFDAPARDPGAEPALPPLLVLACPASAEAAVLAALEALLPEDAPGPDLMLWPLSRPSSPDLELLAAASALLSLSPHPPAAWILAAQAAEKPVLSPWPATALYLERPWCLSPTAASADAPALAWLLRQALHLPPETLAQIRLQQARRHDYRQAKGQLPSAWE